MVLGMALALLATGAARRDTGLERRADHGDVRRGLAGHHATGGLAEVGAIEAETSAARQHLRVALAQVGVRAAGAGGHALQAGLDAARACVHIAGSRLRMRLEHFSNRHVQLLLRRSRKTQHDANRGSQAECSSMRLVVRSPAGVATPTDGLSLRPWRASIDGG